MNSIDPGNREVYQILEKNIKKFHKGFWRSDLFLDTEVTTVSLVLPKYRIHFLFFMLHPSYIQLLTRALVPLAM